MAEEAHNTSPGSNVKPGLSPANAVSPERFYGALPTATSIRILEVLDSQPDDIRCQMRIVDLEDEPDFAALSYTWGNPITVFDNPMPDISHLKYPEDADQFPFMYTTGPLGPYGETMASVDGVKRDYLHIYGRIPYEKVEWKSGTVHRITVNDRPIEVEENLFEYLKSILSTRSRFTERETDGRDPLYESPRLPMWIDALSINQEDLTERAEQVQLMGRIYKSARIILAWIGQDDVLCNVAFDSISKILSWESTRMENVFGEENKDKPKDRDPDDVTLSSVPGMTVFHWFALFALFQRLWFRRAWIAQEAIFSKDLLMLCGGNIMSFKLLLTVFAILEEAGLDHELCRVGRNLLIGQPVAASTLQLENFAALSRKSDDEKPSDHLRELSVVPWDVYSFVLGYHRVRGRLGISEIGRPLLWGWKPGEQRSSNRGIYNVEIPQGIRFKDMIMEEVKPGVYEFHRRPLRLLSVLSDFRNLDATDPRDKIFAFLGLATDKLGLVPDYRASVTDIFRNVTKQMIRKYDSLAVLSHCQDPADTKIPGLPGWVPDFSVRLGRMPFDTGGEVSDFSASGYRTYPLFKFCSDGSLKVEGVRVDTVSDTTDFEGDSVVKVLRLLRQVPHEYPVIPLEWWNKNRPGNKKRRELHPRYTIRIEALWRTLIGDQTTEPEDYPELATSRESFATGFICWVIADILEAYSILTPYIIMDPDIWAVKLIHSSFSTRMALWSELYDKKQTRDGSNLDVPSLGEVFEDLAKKEAVEQERQKLNEQERLKLEEQERLKLEEQERLKLDEQKQSKADEQEQSKADEQEQSKVDELEKSKTDKQEMSKEDEQFIKDLLEEINADEPEKSDVDENLEAKPRAIGLEHFPTATQIMECFNKETDKSKDKETSLAGSYCSNTLQRLTILQRRRLRHFEKHMRKATEGRRLLCSSSGLLGLGPMSTAQDKTRKDEIWLLRGARVPFILRRKSDNRYQIIGEAYIHGLMYGEAVEDDYARDFWEDLHGRMLGCFPSYQKIHLV
jgi:hypothetical protein